MSKKHFEALAAAIKEIEDKAARVEAALAVGRVCANFNKAFDLPRFLAACNAL